MAKETKLSFTEVAKTVEKGSKTKKKNNCKPNSCENS